MPTVTANGLRFTYLEQGSGPLVLLLHGFPDTAHTWDAVMPAIAGAGYRAVAPFMRGYHPTQIPEPAAYDMDTLGNDAVALIGALGADRAIVVGHDWGATATYAASTLAPERVALCITVAVPHPMSMKPTPRMIWVFRHFLALRRRSAAAKLRANDFAYVDELWRRWSPAWEVPASETEHVKTAFREPGCAEAAIGYYRALTPTFRPTSALRHRIGVPAVAFAGEDDSMLKPRAYEKARSWFTASYEVVQMPGGHFLHREHPTHFTSELLRVLRDHAARTAA
jgi:pimeloyl-ACP methyl ester carboxylesterase